MNNLRDRNINEDGLYTQKGLRYVFKDGFMRNHYINASDEVEFEVTYDILERLWNNKPTDIKGYTLIKNLVDKKYGKRPGTEMAGSYIQAKEWKSEYNLNIAGDVNTSLRTQIKKYANNFPEYFPKDVQKGGWYEKNEREIKIYAWKQYSKLPFVVRVFISCAGTIGNTMLIPEGTNSQTWGPSDNIYYKLTTIQSTFGRGDRKKTELIERELKYLNWMKYLLDNNKISLSKNNLFQSYVEIQHFQDYIDINNKSIKNIFENNTPRLNSNEKWKEWFLCISKSIVQRGYRIWYSGEGEDGVKFNDPRPFSQIEKEDKENPDAIRVRQVIDSLIYIVKYIAEKKDNNVFKNPEKYLDECLKNYEIKNPGEYLNENKLKLV